MIRPTQNSIVPRSSVKPAELKEPLSRTMGPINHGPVLPMGPKPLQKPDSFTHGPLQLGPGFKPFHDHGPVLNKPHGPLHTLPMGPGPVLNKPHGPLHTLPMGPGPVLNPHSPLKPGLLGPIDHGPVMAKPGQIAPFHDHGPVELGPQQWHKPLGEGGHGPVVHPALGHQESIQKLKSVLDAVEPRTK